MFDRYTDTMAPHPSRREKIAPIDMPLTAELLRRNGVSLEKTRAALDSFPSPPHPEEGTNYV